MTLDNLSLPVDIPWERRCVSEDMVTDDVCNRDFPARWRSSVSVFSYEPPEEYQEYDGMTVSYLKVVGSITGYQPDGEEVGLDDGRAATGWMDPAVYENYKEMVERSYGCYGAILELGVAPPNADDWDSSEYPYVADFQPKKRQVYELATESNEQMSRTLENVNVRKGTTTTDSHEVLDVFGGFNASAEAKAGGTGGGASFGNKGQWGTRDMNTKEYTNVRTTDRAREQRESFSHTTRLTQMYHQLDSYHLGTNRAMFFMVPRPHIEQNKRTFVNGPRKLEGIQEFFLVVLRPEEMENVDVEAYLETAHIGSTPNYDYETDTRSTSLDVSASCRGDPSGRARDDTEWYPSADSKTYTPPEGWEIDTDRNGGYEISAKSGKRIKEAGVENVGPDQLTLYGKVNAKFVDRTWPTGNICKKGNLHLEVTVYLRKKEPEIESYDQKLWVTGRGICCRAHEPTSDESEDVEYEEEEEPTTTLGPDSDGGTYEESVTWEKSLGRTTTAKVGGQASMDVDQANVLTRDVKRSLYDSMNASDRYAAGTVSFTGTDFLSESVGRLVRSQDHPDNRPVTELAGVDEAVRKKVAANAPRVSRGRVLQAPLAELRDRLALEQEQAIHLKRAALGIEGEAPSPEERWRDPSAERGDTDEVAESVDVPDVEGRELSEARELLEEAGLIVGDRSHVDDEQPRDSVKNQYPNAGESVDAGSDVDLVLSTGLSVMIPDVVGEPLTAAVERLSEAGLRSEPDVQFAPSDELPANHVLEVTPDERSYVTPNERVVLQLSEGEAETEDEDQAEGANQAGAEGA